MHTPERYCDECGAANPCEATVCFACQSRLDDTVSPKKDSRVPAESDTPSACQLQINLAAGSLTLIQLPPSQATPNLLHNRYQLLEKVGTGGFGAVYKARDLQKRDQIVAIKAIELDTLSVSQAIEATDTFHRELHLLSDLNHPSLPRIHDSFIDSHHWYLVMDFIHGEPLDDYCQQIDDSRLPLPEVIDVGLQICDVLHYLHQLQPAIIFRDVKPENIMRTPGGRLYLIDFGIARRFKPGQTRDTTPLGSPGFAAPEQYGREQTTTRTDIYGLGATLYSLLTGYNLAATPFNLPAILSLCPTLPEPLAELITAMLALDPQERPASISLVKAELKNSLSTVRRAALLTSQAPSAATYEATSTIQTPAPAHPTLPHRLSNLLKMLFSISPIFVLLLEFAD